MKDYQLWGFVYLNVSKDNINAITGTKEESDKEELIPCFDGFSFFTFNGHYYLAYYPKFTLLTKEHMKEIEKYCGYEPENGEFGVIMGALGSIVEVSKEHYDSVAVKID